MEITKNKFLMGTDIEIIIDSDYEENKILSDIEESFNIFSDLEKEFSRFDNDSVLSKLNKNKSLVVSDRFLQVFNLSKEINKKTNGYFNSLISLSNIGYSSSFDEKNFNKTNLENNLDLEKIKIDGNKIFLDENQNLDFGGIVKGFTVDLVKDFFEEKGYKNILINGGGDMYISEKSTVGINSPKNNGDLFAILDLENLALSTSGTYKRKWNIGGENYHHILNPKKNINNNEISSISLITKKCYIGDSYATACIAMGIEKSIDFLKQEKISGVIIGNDSRVYKIGDLDKYNFEEI